MEQIIQLNSQAKLSEHFTLGELTKTSHKVYNIPSHEAIENLKRVCGWLEYLRKRYNELNQTTPNPFLRPFGSKRPFGSSASLFEEGNTEGRVLPSSLEEGLGVEEIKHGPNLL